MIELAISAPILEEVHRILRDKFNWPPEQLQEIEPRLSAFTRRVSATQTLDVIKEDSDDNRILECAQAAGSEFIVTGDQDLLRLGQYADIKIVKVSDFLQRGQFQSR